MAKKTLLGQRDKGYGRSAFRWTKCLDTTQSPQNSIRAHLSPEEF